MILLIITSLDTEILQGYLEKANLRFYRNACSVCVKGKLIGQCPSDQQTGLEVSSIFFYLTKNRKYRTKCVTLGFAFIAL